MQKNKTCSYFEVELVCANIIIVMANTVLFLFNGKQIKIGDISYG